MAANKVTAVHECWGFTFQAKTLSRPGNRTALFLDRQLEVPNPPELAASMPSRHFAGAACFVTAGAYFPEQHATQIQRSLESCGCRGNIAMEAETPCAPPVPGHPRYPADL